MSKSVRITPLRQALLDLLTQQHCPLTIADLLSGLEVQGFTPNKTTLYRQLESMKERGEVKELQVFPKMRHFEIHDPTHHHHHFACTACKKLIAVACDTLESAIHAVEKRLEKKGCSVTEHRMKFYGLCEACG